jgi:hypothetical protein
MQEQTGVRLVRLIRTFLQHEPTPIPNLRLSDFVVFGDCESTRAHGMSQKAQMFLELLISHIDHPSVR